MKTYNPLNNLGTFKRVYNHTWNKFITESQEVPPTKWQGVDVRKRPEMTSHELMNYTFHLDLYNKTDLDYWRNDIEPNLPWADNHFEERVWGVPINPGIEWEFWPWGNSANTFRDDNGQFNHNYMERYWSKYAGLSPATKTAKEWYLAHEGVHISPHKGIRNEYGDLGDLVLSLSCNPYSRQEWFPIFHPEDVGEVKGGRKPCSLGYQFWVRENQLHAYYPMRSCDFTRHFKDDLYLTVRLLLWVLNECRKIEDTWDHTDDSYFWHAVQLGTLTFHATSLHVFTNDLIKMKQEGKR